MLNSQYENYIFGEIPWTYSLHTCSDEMKYSLYKVLDIKYYHTIKISLKISVPA